ncbi:Capsid/spike protein, ssDNA virus [Cinara cedri]|uniref:Capsid/spike protein, ssDNA virus n=1 Tax=Cinara cedri TaxID=506608 RepID=A0A5E4MNP8_9HEMI|nr:Capsid/spike protein, ssDNA virus [Cinara cedri]
MMFPQVAVPQINVRKVRCYKYPKEAKTFPGTGDNSDMDPDTGSPSIENAVIPRLIDDKAGCRMVFRKHHSFISYGLVWTSIKDTASDNMAFGTSSLMSIPVDRPFFIYPLSFRI